MRPEDDPRTFWVFVLVGCGHPIGVLINDGFSREGAYLEMYEARSVAVEQAKTRGVDARLIDAPAYHQRWADKIGRGCTC